MHLVYPVVIAALLFSVGVYGVPSTGPAGLRGGATERSPRR